MKLILLASAAWKRCANRGLGLASVAAPGQY